MKMRVEKPVVPVDGKPMIDRVVDALLEAEGVDRVIVAVSGNTPKTARAMRRRGLEVVETPGAGYVLDMRHAIEELKLEGTLVISADLPYVTSRIIDRVISEFEKSGKPALSVMCPLEIYRAHGLSPEYQFSVEGKAVSPVGLNIIDGSRLGGKELDEKRLVLDDQELLYNINTVGDIRMAERRRAKLGRSAGGRSGGQWATLSRSTARSRRH